MKKKYLIFGATGSVGSSLANLMYNDNEDCHLIGRDENELKKISDKLNYSYSVCDVLKLDFTSNLLEDLSSTQILGIAYCVGSIDLKPLKNTKANDYVSSYVLNLVAVTEIMRTFQENLKNNKGSVVNPGFIKTPMTQKNKFAMPMIKSPEYAAQKMFIGLTKKNSFEIHFPKSFTFGMKLLKIMPNWLYFFIVGRGIKTINY